MPERASKYTDMLENLSRKEIAKRMGITVSTVDNHLRKALEYLRATVSGLPEE